VSVFAGEAIVPGRLAPIGTGPGLELKIPPGQRAMAVRINDVAGISGLIQPNSRVDVLVTIQEPGTSKQVAKLFMENMRVLSVGTEIQRDASGKPITATTVTLGVTPQQAERLAVAMNQGAIQLVLRGYGDPDSVKTGGATSSDVLSQLRGERAVAPPPSRTGRAAPRPAAPAPVIVIQRPPPPPDSAIVNVYRAGKSTPLKFDTATKH
jgi:pilus assembly protein CpaB